MGLHCYDAAWEASYPSLERLSRGREGVMGAIGLLLARREVGELRMERRRARGRWETQKVHYGRTFYQLIIRSGVNHKRRWHLPRVQARRVTTLRGITKVRSGSLLVLETSQKTDIIIVCPFQVSELSRADTRLVRNRAKDRRNLSRLKIERLKRRMIRVLAAAGRS